MNNRMMDDILAAQNQGSYDPTNIFDRLAQNGGAVETENTKTVSAEEVQQVFKKMNAPKRQLKTYTITYQTGDGYDEAEVRADEFFVASGILFFSKRDEVKYMVSVNNLIAVDINDDEEEEEEY